MRNLATRVKQRIAAVSLMAFAAVTMALPAFASTEPAPEPPPPTVFEQVGGEMNTLVDQTQAFGINYVVPAFAILLALGIAIALFRKWSKRAASSI